MTDGYTHISMPASREPVTLLAVDRAVSELRRGRMVVLSGGGGEAVLAEAAEAVTAEDLTRLATLGGSVPVLAITSRRAAVLSLGAYAAKVVTLTAPEPLTAPQIRELADPLSDLQRPHFMGLHPAEAALHGCDSAAVALTKLARLLPAAVTVRLTNADADDRAAWAARHDLLQVDAGDIFQYEITSARTLRAVGEARVPLLEAQDTRIVAYRPLDGGLEHLAIIIGEPDPTRPALARLHSECFTGDLLGSLRCDCGDQLRGAIDEIARAGGGILLYLAQEGRGIGLVNKLHAYELQDRGFDTMDANQQLGFDADERVYLPAARMLRHLGFNRVRLLTNNPDKVDALSRYGIVVEERVQHAFPSNKHNEAYLRAKAARGGHLF
ncbi:MAG: GTP cyclohydrolase II [Rhodospirillales bacterium]|jgi:GTP cyclohydrolase II|nr:GTP cyclohydrolase II [Rhodospirillales bacterium]MDP6773566.1 GTP cyclohydrolase II [Rhodospirillales bacterium]